MGELLLTFLAGIAIGGIYFAGLWETVRRLPDTKKPFRTMVASFALRMALALAGLTLIMQGQWERMAVAMLGFLAVRGIMLRKLGNTSYGIIGGTANGNRGH